MVDVGHKRASRRTAIATAAVRVSSPAAARVLGERSGDVAKGNVLRISELAGICGAKHTALLIPLCHNLPLDAVDTRVVVCRGGWELRVVTRARTTGVTGVEMEAMVAASVAALTAYDMLKAIDKAISIADTRLLVKVGGKSGLYVNCGSGECDHSSGDGTGLDAETKQRLLAMHVPSEWLASLH